MVDCSPGEISGILVTLPWGNSDFVDGATSGGINERPIIKTYRIDYKVDVDPVGSVTASSNTLLFYGEPTVLPALNGVSKCLAIEGYPRWFSDVSPCYREPLDPFAEYFYNNPTMTSGKLFNKDIKHGNPYITNVSEFDITGSNVDKIINNYQKYGFPGCRDLSFMPPFPKFKCNFLMEDRTVESRYYTYAPTFSLGCREPSGCPDGTCEVNCGDTVCCYGADGVSVDSFPLKMRSL